jgi:hypothetical protein
LYRAAAALYRAADGFERFKRRAREHEEREYAQELLNTYGKLDCGLAPEERTS